MNRKIINIAWQEPSYGLMIALQWCLLDIEWFRQREALGGRTATFSYMKLWYTVELPENRKSTCTSPGLSRETKWAKSNL